MSENQDPIIIVGGGTAGLSVAARLRRSLHKTNIVLIEPSDKHYYQPLWTLVGAGMFDSSESTKNVGTLVPSKVEWIRDRVTEFLPNQKRVKTVVASFSNIRYWWFVQACK